MQCAPRLWHDINGSTALAHLVVTRFCLYQGNLSALVRLRLSLLATITRASLTTQLSCRFTWLVYHDDSLQKQARAALRKVVERDGGGRFVVVHMAHKQAHLLPVKQQLEAIGRWTPPRGQRTVALMTRLDADDALAQDSILALQRAALHSLACEGVDRVPAARSSSPPGDYVACFAGAYNWYPVKHGAHPDGGGALA